MIELYDGYVIKVDELQYTLAKATGKIDKRSGRPVYDPIGYYADLRAALTAFGRRNIRVKLKDGSLALGDALLAIQNELDRLEKFIKDNIPEV